MFFFNLTLTEFLALFAGMSSVVAALYLLDRTRQKHRVATLRFWAHSDAPSEMQHRRKIQQPWSLLLQLLGILLLLAAIAQLRWGSPLDLTRDHVLVLDTSAVMEARAGTSTWMEQSRAAARQWLRAVPKGDRVMLVRADALATPATAFESNPRAVEEALAASRPSASALRLDTALRFARQAQAGQGRRKGEIVYVGSGRTAEEDSGFAESLDNLRVVLVKGSFENVGLRKIGLRRNAAGTAWETYVQVRNDGTAPRLVPIALTLGGAPAALRQLSVPPGGEASFTSELRISGAGALEARLQVRDMFPGDDRAVMELPSQTPPKVAVFSSQPELLRPLFSNSRVTAVFRSPSEYDPSVDASLVVLDRTGTVKPSKAAVLWINPPRGGPIQTKSESANAELSGWNTAHPLGNGLNTRDLRLDSASVLRMEPGDVAIASIASGPVVIARPKDRLVALGFHPMLSPMRFDLATPLLFANVLRWVLPGVFLNWELNAGSAGSVTLPLETDAGGSLTAKTEDGTPVPFTLSGRSLRLFAGSPGVVRVNDGRRELVLSLTLPELASTVWDAPGNARRGVPRALDPSPAARDLWQWLAMAGAACLIVEWLLFGRARRLFRSQPVGRPALRRAS
jgi:hypothetical protein